jgi:hypothetical protein
MIACHTVLLYRWDGLQLQANLPAMVSMTSQSNTEITTTTGKHLFKILDASLL